MGLVNDLKTQAAEQQTQAASKRLAEQLRAIRQERIESAHELAAIIEPLAESLASLTDETRSVLRYTQQQTEATQQQASKQIQASQTRLDQQMQGLTQVADQLKTASEQASQRLRQRKKNRRWPLVAVLITALVCAAGPTAILYWQHQKIANMRGQVATLQRIADHVADLPPAKREIVKRLIGW